VTLKNQGVINSNQKVIVDNQKALKDNQRTILANRQKKRLECISKLPVRCSGLNT
jgi:hypothetical protein